MTGALIARIISIATVYFVVSRYPTPIMVAATYSVSIAHYILSYFYSWRQIRQVLSQVRSGTLFGAMTVAAWRMISVHSPLWAIFSFHHAFNESYTADATTSGDRTEFLTTPRVISSFAIYLIVQYKIVLPYYNLQAWLVTIIIASSLAIALLIVTKRLYANAIDLLMLITFEVLSFWPLVVCREQGLALWEIALYHVTFWLTYPLIGMARKSVACARRYFVFHVLVMIAIWQILPLGCFHLISWEQSMWTFSCLTTLHILHSLSTSDAEPKFLRRLFRPLDSNLSFSFAKNSDGAIHAAQKKPIQTS